MQELADGGALPWFQGLMQTRDPSRVLGEQPSDRLDHGRSALERDHLSTEQVHDMATIPGPYCRGPGMVAGKLPLVRVWQRGQVLISAVT